MTTQLRLRYWPGMRLTWVDGSAVVHTGNSPSGGAMAVVASSVDSGESSVVVGSHTVRILPAMVEELSDALAAGLPRGCRRMRMVAWDSGSSTEDRPAPAHILAHRLGIEVLAPAGPLLGVPGNSLFAPHGRGEHKPGGWWRFAPGATPLRVGWRFPAPAWEIDLSEAGDLSDDLVLDQIPAGVWLHRPGQRSVTDLVYSIPIDPAAPALVLSHPSETPLRADELARAVATLPRRAAERVIITPYGSDPVVGGRAGEIAAAVFGHTVRVRPGLPLCAPSGGRAVVAIDGNGVPRWRPFARELQYSPRRPSPGVVDCANPAPGFLDTQQGPATYGLTYDWVVEVIEPGLWLRPAQLTESAEWIRALPLDTGRCVVVLGAPGAHHPLPSSQSVAALLEHLPGDARTRVRLIVPRGTPADVFHLASGLQSLLPGVSDVLILGDEAPEPRPDQSPLAQPHMGAQSLAQTHGLSTRDPMMSTGSFPRPDLAPTGAGALPGIDSTGSFRRSEQGATGSSGRPEVSGPPEPPARFDPVSPPRNGHHQQDDSSPRREVRSHRTGEKPILKEETRQDTKELKRLLGFFDEIRRAKAWDEDPERDESGAQQPSASQYR